MMVSWMVLSVTAKGQADTITGWDFSDSTNHSFNANMGLSGNLGFDIRAEDTIGSVRTLFYTNGSTNFAAATTDWDAGENNKFWSVKFKAAGYGTFKLYSVQSSESANPGPKYWKIQVRKSGDAWTDLPGGNIVVANDWTTGVINGLTFPSSFDNPGSTSIYVRWIMTSNESTNGTPVSSTGVSIIDDIIITGETYSGVETILYDSRIHVFPNPSSHFVNISCQIPGARAKLFNATGNAVREEILSLSGETIINVSNLSSGLYLLVLETEDGSLVGSRKLLIGQ